MGLTTLKTKHSLIVLVLAVAMILPAFTAVTATTSFSKFTMGKPNRYCTITNPANGATVSGIVTITVDATGTPTIAIDGNGVTTAYSYTWDTTAYADGSHTIKANYKNAADEIIVTVDNGGGPVNNPPEVTITAPANGATVSGTVTISVTVNDEDTITPDIYIDGSYITTAYTYDWDTTAYADGAHDIYAEATDSGSLTGSDTNSVTVDNSGGGGVTEILPWWNDAIDVEQQSYTGAGSVVVVIDTGLVSNYLDYFPAENILTQYCRSYTKELGKDNVEWNQDTEGHGTAVTGTVIGYYLDSETWVNGVAEDAKIVMLRCIYWVGGFGPPHKVVTETDMLNNWADCINYARSLAANELSAYNMVISMSLGYDNSNANLDNAIAGAEAEGIVVSTSAGNEGPGAGTTAYPANLAEVTSVGACGHVDYTDAYGIAGIGGDIPEGDFSGIFLSDFSSRGKVDVCGIGENLVLPYYGGYYYISGTSFSCPQTSGVFALMFEAYGSQSVQWLESKLQGACVDLGYTVEEQGAGFIQADGAVA
jgi:hypothetical protein